MIGKLVKLNFDINQYGSSDNTKLFRNEICLVIEQYPRTVLGTGVREIAYKIKSLKTGNISRGIVIGHHVELLTEEELLQYKTVQVLYGR